MNCTDPTCFPTPHERSAHTDPVEMAALERARDRELARSLRAQGYSLFEVATRVGRSKEWLREYVGLR